jgi:hypothetical protein
MAHADIHGMVLGVPLPPSRPSGGRRSEEVTSPYQGATLRACWNHVCLRRPRPWETHASVGPSVPRFSPAMYPFIPSGPRPTNDPPAKLLGTHVCPGCATRLMASSPSPLLAPRSTAKATVADSSKQAMTQDSAWALAAWASNSVEVTTRADFVCFCGLRFSPQGHKNHGRLRLPTHIRRASPSSRRTGPLPTGSIPPSGRSARASRQARPSDWRRPGSGARRGGWGTKGRPAVSGGLWPPLKRSSGPTTP